MPGDVFSCQAIVLDQRDYGEADLIVSLFDPERGKLQTIAKSARKSKRRFVNKLEIFTLLNVILRPSRTGLLVLEEAELLNSFCHLRQSVAPYAAATLIREFLLAIAHEGDADPEMFLLALWAVESLDRGLPCRVVAAQFLIRYYDRIGYRPELEHCRECGVAGAASRHWRFSAGKGGVLCPLCAAPGGDLRNGQLVGLPLQPGTAKFLSSCRLAPLARLGRLKIAGPPLEEALNILQRYGDVVLGREIVSWRLFWRLTGNP